MCGRYRLSRRKQVLAEHFEANPFDDDWEPRYNIAPTQPVPVVRQHPKEKRCVLSMMRWGLVPSWAKDASGSASMINARSETAVSKPAFRDPIKFRRCLIPADGFYEWRRTGSSKQPYCFEVNNGEMFAFAGLWDGWKDANGQWIKSCSILTTVANGLTLQVHDRMPVILRREDHAVWLDPRVTNIDAICELLKPYDASQMRCYPVSSRINVVANDDQACAAPVEVPEAQPGLF
jgi:putative SOS response-associated peptidase YedK